jgi:hypothetical protein
MKDQTMTKKTTKKAESTETANPPVAKIRVGLITASIWERKTDVGTFHTTTFDRRYKDRSGKWKSSSSYDALDLLTLSKLADLAHTKVLELQNPQDTQPVQDTETESSE